MVRAFLILNIIAFAMAFSSPAFAQTYKRGPQDILSEENILIVEVKIGKYQFDSAIEIYQSRDRFFVPLTTLVEILEFPIDVDVEEKEAKGWFIAESRSFSLSIDRKEAIISGKILEVPEGAAIANNDDIYVDSTYLEQWFPLKVSLDFSSLSLIIEPKEKLPFELKKERELLRQKSLRSRQEKEVDYPVIYTPYHPYSIPVTDIQIGYEYDNNVRRENNIAYSLLSRGDLAYLESELFLSGNTNQSLQTARLSTGRRNDEGGLLGALDATEFRIGDINGVNVPFVTNSSLGRGMRVTNRNLDRPDQFDTTNFIGNAPPNWEVEIYRNNILVDFQTVGSNGRYEFFNVPVLYGNNSFRIVQYGPEGQIRESTVTRNIGASLLQKGSFAYQLSADERSYSLFGVDEQNRTIQHNRNMRFVSTAEYGLNEYLTLGSGFISTPLNDRQLHQYQTAIARFSLGRVLAEANLAYDYKDQGKLYSINATTSLYDVSVNAKYSHYNNFSSEVVEPLTSQQRISVAELRLNGRIDKRSYLPSPISYTFSGLNEVYENNISQQTFTNRTSLTLLNLGFSNFLQHVESTNNQNVTTQTTGEFSVRGRYDDIILRMNSNYTLAPEETFNFISFTAQKRLSEKANGQVDIRKNFGENSDTTTLGLTYNRLFDKYQLSFSTSADDEGNMNLATRLSFALGYDTQSNQAFMRNQNASSGGTILAHSYLDNNDDGTFNDGDETLEGTGYFYNNRSIKPKTTNNSQVITQVQPYSDSIIRVDQTTLEDPFLSPNSEGYKIYTRPGAITPIEFAFVPTTEIDGMLYLENFSFNPKGLANIPMELVNIENGKTITTISEFDGFFLFKKVRSGTYEIRIAKEGLDKLGLASASVYPVTVPQNSDFITGLNYVLQATDWDSIYWENLLLDDDDSLFKSLSEATDTEEQGADTIETNSHPQPAEEYLEKLPLTPLNSHVKKQ